MIEVVSYGGLAIIALYVGLWVSSEVRFGIYPLLWMRMVDQNTGAIIKNLEFGVDDPRVGRTGCTAMWAVMPPKYFGPYTLRTLIMDPHVVVAEIEMRGEWLLIPEVRKLYETAREMKDANA